MKATNASISNYTGTNLVAYTEHLHCLTPRVFLYTRSHLCRCAIFFIVEDLYTS